MDSKKVAGTNTGTKLKHVLVYQIIKTIKKYQGSKMCEIARVSKSGYYK